jgi:hypothetical protein
VEGEISERETIPIDTAILDFCNTQHMPPPMRKMWNLQMADKQYWKGVSPRINIGLSPPSLNIDRRITLQVLSFPVHGVQNAVDTVESKESDPIDLKTDYPEY